MNLWELCKCNEGQICPFCKFLTVVFIVAVSGVLGYLIGRRNKG